MMRGGYRRVGHGVDHIHQRNNYVNAWFMMMVPTAVVAVFIISFWCCRHD